MSSSASVWRADCRLRLSRIEQGAGLLAHGLAALLIGFAFIPLLARLVLMAALLGLALRNLRRQRRGVPGAVIAFREYGEDWWLETADGEGRRVLLLPGVMLWRRLLVLRFGEVVSSGRPRRWTVAVFPDSLSPDEFRRLYVRLRFRRTPEAVADDAASDSPELDS